MGRILLPIETKSREFFGKTWLAMNLAEQGHQVIIGDKAPIYSRYEQFEPDVFIEKSAFAGEHHYERVTELSEAGCVTVFLDEEGGVFRSKESYSAKRSNRLINEFHHIFAWGNAQAEALCEYSNFSPDKITVSGNPRFDLLHNDLRSIYSKKSDEIYSKFGDFILFNTNFAIANHHDPDKLDPEMSRNRTLGTMEQLVESLISRFLTAIEELCEIFEQTNIVIRPHPSEDPSTYENHFSDCENVYVNWSGDVREWILASQAVVHNSCTTGIESALMGVPTFALLDPQEEQRVELPNVVSTQVNSVEELASAISAYKSNEHNIEEEAKNQLQKYFYNIDEQAAPVIANEIDNLIDEDSSTHFTSEYTPYRDWDDFKKSPLGRFLKSIYYQFSELPSSRIKFRGITHSEMNDAVDIFSSLSESRKPTVEAVTRFEDVYIISPNPKQ